jgi:CheY-like chemotaxis protein
MVKRLVLIDDDHEDLEIIEEAILVVNPLADVRKFVDACEALAYLRLHDLPDVILIDLNMPKLSGIECLKQLREEPKFNSIYIVVHSSALPPKEMIDTIVKFRGVMLKKPATISDLNNAIHNVLNRSQSF